MILKKFVLNNQFPKYPDFFSFENKNPFYNFFIFPEIFFFNI